MTDTTAEPDRPDQPPAVRCAWTVRDTPIGPLLLAATDEGLVNVVFHATDDVVTQALARLTGRLGTEPYEAYGASEVYGPPEPAETSGPGDPSEAGEPRGAGEPHGAAGATAAPPALATAVAELTRYFAGAPGPFTVPLDWSLTGGFHERVLRELAASVPYGSTVGYQDLADRVGDPGAARAVGAAMGANPLPVVVPCHRVLESGGALGGFGGGRETKRTLLTLEGLLPEPLF